MGWWQDFVDRVGGNDSIRLYAKARRTLNGVEWALGESNPPLPGKKELVFDKGAPGRKIVIHLVPTGGLDIKFNECDPFWACETGCPPPANASTDQLQFVECKDKTLTLFDPNSRECVVSYQMNFIGAEPFDPDIRNGGTNRA